MSLAFNTWSTTERVLGKPRLESDVEKLLTEVRLSETAIQMSEG